MSDNPRKHPIEQLIFGEGLCDGCGELKLLAVVTMRDGDAVGYLKTRPDGSQYVMPAPRHGYCGPCALAAAKAGKFGKPRET